MTEPKNDQKRLLILIDGNAVLHRAWHALPPLATRDGRVISGAYGFMMTMLSAVRKFSPSHLIVTFDLAQPTFRHEKYGEYKAGRAKHPDELYAQIPIVEGILERMGVPVLTAEGYEADDVIGTVARMASEADREMRTVIVTGDLDTLQLVNDRVHVFTMRRGLTDTVTYDPARVEERYGLRPSQMIDYKALRGDPSDNIPGVRGIGEKTASQLISEFGSIEKLYRTIEGEKGPSDKMRASVRERLINGKNDALKALDLVRIRTDVPIDLDLKAAEYRTVPKSRIEPLFEELQFNRLLEQWPDGKESPPTSPREEREEGKTTVTPKKKEGKEPDTRTERTEFPETGTEDGLVVFLENLRKAEKMAFRCLLADDRPSSPEILGIGINDGRQNRFLDLPTVKRNLDALKKILSSPESTKYCHDLKRETTALGSLGLKTGGTVNDLMLASYLMLAGERKSELPSLLAYYRDIEPEPKNRDSAGKRERLAAELPHLIPLTDEFLGQIEKSGMTPLYRDIEVPLAPVLSGMERFGVMVDRDYFRNLSAELKERLDALTGEIHRLAGEKFNINSPKQLQEILFGRLALNVAGLKRTAKNREMSTAASELEKMAGLHPIIEPILAYREATKIRSTYADTLPEMADPDSGRIHARFNQAVTATGRLSSSDPNLQNIPTRDSQWAERVRRGFVAPKGSVLLAADYSQIELRIAAHIAQEEMMIESFRRGEDIHWRTAAAMFGEGEAEGKRRVAKAINFGILFGMGANRLAASANIGRAEAQEYIDQYFAIHPGLARYISETKAKVARDGYVETIFGRRRFFRNFWAMNQRERAEAERQAINTPIQGSEADMIKLAMIRLDRRLRDGFGDGVRMIIQVHDELIFEMDEGLERGAGPVIRDTMASVTDLTVPIEVKLKVGRDWGRMGELELT
ncbi:DNA polymerase I [Candidatus Uhrbacteria bacterium]|nr:DNA polymerase I [Candidatus Uhrbacteria bacterium]